MQYRKDILNIILLYDQLQLINWQPSNLIPSRWDFSNILSEFLISIHNGDII